eukprot:CAMPEP_0177211724 /NCGR_PEP_ID=MMETSP0367-20130122/32245_1 /TAXON_ID=447022 ORGANISM="Scrippsiella hangoei-like, Strain SHHI-4" /NCGR_SAMPLE_ID=MMETSP0367 /ASSEMBLY_ACC=CAM_ASM_000362 /LENGTH=302 /DNA_ID=CAMNT_0018660929 /DNA_START=254 /DNA_END=1159 /DNA_ORIENTATION=+
MAAEDGEDSHLNSTDAHQLQTLIGRPTSDNQDDLELATRVDGFRPRLAESDRGPPQENSAGISMSLMSIVTVVLVVLTVGAGANIFAWRYYTWSDEGEKHYLTPTAALVSEFTKVSSSAERQKHNLTSTAALELEFTNISSSVEVDGKGGMSSLEDPGPWNGTELLIDCDVGTYPMVVNSVLCFIRLVGERLALRHVRIMCLHESCCGLAEADGLSVVREPAFQSERFGYQSGGQRRSHMDDLVLIRETWVLRELDAGRHVFRLDADTCLLKDPLADAPRSDLVLSAQPLKVFPWFNWGFDW